MMCNKYFNLFQTLNSLIYTAHSSFFQPRKTFFPKEKVTTVKALVIWSKMQEIQEIPPPQPLPNKIFSQEQVTAILF